MVARIRSQHVIEFNIVNLIRSFGLEAPADEVVLLIVDVQFHVVKDRPESCAGDETTLAAIFVLEERLEQQPSVFDFSTNADECLVQQLFFFVIEHVLGIEN